MSPENTARVVLYLSQFKLLTGEPIDSNYVMACIQKFKENINDIDSLKTIYLAIEAAQNIEGGWHNMDSSTLIKECSEMLDRLHEHVIRFCEQSIDLIDLDFLTRYTYMCSEFNRDKFVPKEAIISSLC